MVIGREGESFSGSERDKLTYTHTWIHGYWERGKVLLRVRKRQTDIHTCMDTWLLGERESASQGQKETN